MADSTVLVTIRVIRSFEYRTCRNLVIPVNAASMTVGALKLACQEHINKDAKFKPYRHIVFDTLKLYTQAFGNKTQNLIINLESTEFLDDDSAVLEAVGVRSETELSFFNRVDYDRYAENPVTLW